MSERTCLRLCAAPVSETSCWSLEDDLLSGSGRGWERLFLRRARGVRWSLRGRSRDRLRALGESFSETFLRPRLRPEACARLRRDLEAGRTVLLESRGLEQAVVPLAQELGAQKVRASQLEFRDGRATGRLLPGRREIALGTAGRPLPLATLVGVAPARLAALAPLSVREALAGRRILLAGSTGFIGKVWLASLLKEVAELEQVFVVVRARGYRSGRERFEAMLERSPVFDAIRGRTLERVEVVEGDLARRDLGLDPEQAQRLAARLDLVVNCAGLTGFNPDPREALAVNVDGPRHLAAFARRAQDAAFLHVSTCFVSGCREGRIPEALRCTETPSGRGDFDPLRERDRLARAIQRIGRGAGGSARRGRRQRIEAGLARARALGWPNIYTFTKALGEAQIAAQPPELPWAIVRPSIVESAARFPMRGWNEGINTSAPLSHLLGTLFRQLPVNDRKHLDVIPVDLVARGITLVVAALLQRRHAPVYQLATSARNPLDLRRAVELTALAHRKYYRQRPGWRNRLLAHLEAIPVSRRRYERWSVPAQLRFFRALNRIWEAALPGKAPLARAERTLRRVQELIELYEPFLLDNEPVFETDHIEILAEALPPEERNRFGYDIHELDWYDYWVNVHIPGLRRWSFPLLEGRSVKAGARGRALARARRKRPLRPEPATES